jgi:LysM repeat protein
VAWSISGCGYVLVKVTAPPPTATPTSPVQLATPDRRATSTPIPSTPLPTATATATPTPIVHVVQKGENLLAISFQYDVSLQALIEVNGIDNPRALRIGQELIIPPEEGSALVVRPTATSTPMPLQVVNLAFHRTPVGGLWCMGEVENERDEFLERVQLHLTLYNADGERIAEATSFTATDIVPGHGKAPFALLLPRTGGFASYELLLLSAEPVTYWGRRHRALTVEQVAGEMAGGTFSVEGVVHNQGQEEAQEVRITVTAYGSDGTVVGVRQTDLTELGAGERRSFALSLIPAAPAVALDAVAWGLKESP